ncbi:MAG: Rrf2 family transcriptional regulator [Tepidisphaeraceae bacterium]|jgi:Rrf2 family protein
MISMSAEYALRAVLCLAGNPAVPMTIQQIAAAGKIPPAYLAKILKSLVRHSILGSQRGLNGGFVLARPADQLTLLDIVNLTDTSHRIHTCPLGLKSHGTNLCCLHRQLDSAVSAAERQLAGATIAQLLAKSPPGKSGCCNWPEPSTPLLVNGCVHHPERKS